MTDYFYEADPISPLCPYCGDIHICKHLALVVDLTYRDIYGGYLEEEFTKRLEVCDEGDDFRTKNFAGVFDGCIQELRQSKKYIEIKFEDDIGPGASSAYSSFYNREDNDAPN